MKETEFSSIYRDFPVVFEEKITWKHIDSAQHVNNVVYLEWFEDARVHYFESLGYDILNGNPSRPGIILGWQECKYISPLDYLDTVVIGVKITEMEPDRFYMECQMWSKKNQQVSAIARGRIVSYDYSSLSKTNISVDLKEKIERLEGKKYRI
jgi:acyl-CoA thioester hydrolase